MYILFLIFKKMKTNVREASTLILAAYNGSVVKKGWDYSILSLLRSPKSKFMPRGTVFPGGTVHSFDADEKWLNLFSNSIIKNHDISKIKEAPSILNNQVGLIPKLLSLKITAIRETFEETGILLCKKKDTALKHDELSSLLCPNNIDIWRKKVQLDPSEFFILCQDLNCYPDVQSLNLWSNWLTPFNVSTKRFNTCFFIACVNKNLNIAPDDIEVTKAFWSSPDELATLHKNKDIWLPPPQFYEISRLLKFQNIHCLEKFSVDRSQNGCYVWMPEKIETLDGSVYILPGDELYENTNYNEFKGREKINSTAEEFRLKFNTLHRIESITNLETRIIIQNYHPKDGHILPQNF